MPLHLYLGDITKMKTDAIVNAANTDLKPYPGICEAVFQAAGEEKLEKACREIGHCAISRVVVTPGYRLPAKCIIHVAGPGWYGGAGRKRFLMAACCQHALQKAVMYSCRNISFPLIFSGDCHIPRAEFLKIAGNVIREFLKYHEMEVYLVLYKQEIYEMARILLGET